MIGQSLVFVCATFALVAGSCIQQGLVSTGCSSPVATISSPVAAISSPVAAISSPVAAVSSPVGYNSILSSGLGLASGVGLGLPITDGPLGTPITVVQAPPVTLPTVQTPIISLPSQPIPPTRVISERCVCTKTIVKPNIYQRLVTVPKIQRYLKRTVTPVVENISYKSTPVSRTGLKSSVVLAPRSPVVGTGVSSASPVIVSRPSAACSC